MSAWKDGKEPPWGSGLAAKPARDKTQTSKAEAETRAPEGIGLSVLDCVSGKPWCGVLRVDCIAKRFRQE
jgi:hypothetical protein